jgi:hypothetical protein
MIKVAIIQCSAGISEASHVIHVQQTHGHNLLFERCWLP